MVGVTMSLQLGGRKLALAVKQLEIGAVPNIATPRLSSRGQQRVVPRRLPLAGVETVLPGDAGVVDVGDARASWAPASRGGASSLTLPYWNRWPKRSAMPGCSAPQDSNALSATTPLRTVAA